MNPRSGGRKWIKLWVEPWLDGTTRFEMSDVQRAFWVDLLAMAGRSRFPGVICAGEVDGQMVGYPLNKFQALMSGPIDVLATLQLFQKTGKITMQQTHDTPVPLFVANVLNWDKYQSEYQRQKPYRQAKLRNGLQKGDNQSDNRGDSKGNTTEVEVDVEGEEEERSKTLEPLPGNTSSLAQNENPKSLPTSVEIQKRNAEKQIRDAQVILRRNQNDPGAKRAYDEASGILQGLKMEIKKLAQEKTMP